MTRVARVENGARVALDLARQQTHIEVIKTKYLMERLVNSASPPPPPPPQQCCIKLVFLSEPSFVFQTATLLTGRGDFFLIYSEKKQNIYSEKTGVPLTFVRDCKFLI